MRRFFTTLFALSLIYIAALQAQESVTLTPAKDNTLYEDETGLLSNGSGQYLFSGRVGTTGGTAVRRALLSFAIADSIPAGSTIDTVFLTLRMSKTPTGAKTVLLNRVQQDWGEGPSNATGGEGSGTSAATGDATWVHTFFNTTTWTSEGGDYESGASASQSVSGIGSYTWGSTTNMVADVQAWLDTPAENFGWIVIGDESTGSTVKRFDSRESPTAANRPQLTVHYTPSTSALPDIVSNSSLPGSFSLDQNYPNPFNPSTRIRFSVPLTQKVAIRIFNLLGQEVTTLFSGVLPAQNYELEWNGKNSLGFDVPSGVYFYSMNTSSFSASKKMILVR